MDTLLERADREPDGAYRIVASKALPGKPFGRIRFVDTRPDDPNDVVPHQHRRDAIGRAYLTAINPIADPMLDCDDILTFRNASVDADFASAPARYRAVWFRFDNATAHSEHIAETRARSTRLEAPTGPPRHDGAFVKIELSSIDGFSPSWDRPINVFFRYQKGQWQLVGLERMAS